MSKLVAIILAISTCIYAVDSSCMPDQPANCTTMDTQCDICLGPSNTLVNAPVRPLTCDGDFVISASVFYWQAIQDGMEYAVDTDIYLAMGVITQDSNPLIDAHYEVPNFHWNLGFKFGLSYNSACDGWDVQALWTHFRGKASSHIESSVIEKADPVIKTVPVHNPLIAIWSDFSIGQDGVTTFGTYATDIKTRWNCDIDLLDIELGREFWLSRYLSFRPSIGFRLARINQTYKIHYAGGAWSEMILISPVIEPARNNEVALDNNYKGIGILAGLDSIWNFGRGWAVYGNVAGSIVYGRFTIDHKEDNRLAQSPFSKTVILDTSYSFRASRAMLDLGLGLQWSTMFCDCKYGLTTKLGWEQHLFFHQNLLQRVNRISRFTQQLDVLQENVYSERSGTLATQGLTLTFVFEF